jgi:hypothetical protein
MSLNLGGLNHELAEDTRQLIINRETALELLLVLVAQKHLAQIVASAPLSVVHLPYQSIRSVGTQGDKPINV